MPTLAERSAYVLKQAAALRPDKPDWAWAVTVSRAAELVAGRHPASFHSTVATFEAHFDVINAHQLAYLLAGALELGEEVLVAESPRQAPTIVQVAAPWFVALNADGVPIVDGAGRMVAFADWADAVASIDFAGSVYPLVVHLPDTVPVPDPEWDPATRRSPTPRGRPAAEPGALCAGCGDVLVRLEGQTCANCQAEDQ